MERLTKNNGNGDYYYPKCFEKCDGLGASSKCDNCEITTGACEKLGKYEDLEEHGLLLRLPCGIGTIVYKVENNADACSECSDFEKGYCCDDCCGNKNVHDEDGDIYVPNPQYADKPLCQKHFYEVNEYTMSNVDEIFNMRRAFGKTLFLNKEEAEAKLKELRGGER